MANFDTVPLTQVRTELTERIEGQGRTRETTMAINKRGHLWATNPAGHVVVFEPSEGRSSLPFGRGGHTGGPYCLRCERLYCVGCGGGCWTERCNLAPTLVGDDDDE